MTIHKIIKKNNKCTYSKYLKGGKEASVSIENRNKIKNPQTTPTSNEKTNNSGLVQLTKHNQSNNKSKKRSLFLQVNEILEMINAENLVGNMYKEIYKELNSKIKKSTDNNIKKYLDDNGNLDVIKFSKMMVGKLKPTNMKGGKKVILKKKNTIKYLKNK